MRSRQGLTELNVVWRWNSKSTRNLKLSIGVTHERNPVKRPALIDKGLEERSEHIVIASRLKQLLLVLHGDLLRLELIGQIMVCFCQVCARILKLALCLLALFVDLL